MTMTAIQPLEDATAASARDWALWLTRQPTVNGSPGEQGLPLVMAERVRTHAALAACETWLIKAEHDPLERACLAVLARGTGRDTVLLTGHFDTVSISDYGDLQPLATEPEALREALLQRLSQPVTESEMLARADLASGEFLPGRGLLDMKAGLAAGLAALEAFLADPTRQGNLLFVAVPDEEVTSVGARALAAALPAVEQERGLSVVAAINLDCIGDIGDGSTGRAVAMGSVGKLLPTAFVVGQPSHASHPFQGINAVALAGALAARMEWAPELADAHAGQPGIPPTLLSSKDSKHHYDVTTPDSAFLTWNALTLRRGAGEVMDAFERLVRETVAEFRAGLARRRDAVMNDGMEVPAVEVIRTAQLVAEAVAAGGQAELEVLAAQLVANGLSLPDQNQRITEAAWRLSGRRGSALVIGFGSLPYPSVLVGESERGRRLVQAVEKARARAMAETGESIIVTGFFPGISDMSFLGEADTEGLALVAANTPAWNSGVRWGGRVGGVPTINAGPWGRDYHTPLERLHTRYAFHTLPMFLLDIARNSLGAAEPEAGA
jgi:arginine utilization protein RocB